MADPLYELLVPYFDAHDALPSATSTLTTTYLTHLTTLPFAALSTTEPQSLLQASQSLLRSLQSLSKRSHKPIIASADHLLNLRSTLPHIAQHAGAIHNAVPQLETAAQRFADKYSKSSENAVLDQRRKALLLSRNIDRVADVLELPTLLSSAIASSTSAAQAPGASAATYNANYAAALDLHAHIKRLHTLYPSSALVSSLALQAEEEMKGMSANLIASLQSQNLKLAAAMRTIGWLRRVAPELDTAWSAPHLGFTNFGSTSSNTSSEGGLGALFLVCRLRCLHSMFSALDPLRELADAESERRMLARPKGKGEGGWQAGAQTEKYLKKYLEVFREQSFAVISMYKSIFPGALPPPTVASDESGDATAEFASAPVVQPPTFTASANASSEALQPTPSPLSTFPAHLIALLSTTLHTYLPNISDRAARDSLLTQVLYCAGSLGRLGGDFSLVIALLEEDLRAEFDEEEVDDEAVSGGADEKKDQDEWVDVMKKHRVQASRLELLASGVGVAGRTGVTVDRVISPVK